MRIGMLSRAAISAVVAGTLFSSIAHAAECASRGVGITGAACNNCVYEGSMIVKRDQACERPYRPNAKGQVLEIISNRVTQRAKHGVAGVDGNTLAYAPSKGYVGTDEFIVLVNYRLGKEVGKFFMHMSVTVQ